MGRLTSTPYLVLFIILGAVGITTAYALATITLAGDVNITGNTDIDGNLNVDGTITGDGTGKQDFAFVSVPGNSDGNPVIFGSDGDFESAITQGTAVSYDPVSNRFTINEFGLYKVEILAKLDRTDGSSSSKTVDTRILLNLDNIGQSRDTIDDFLTSYSFRTIQLAPGDGITGKVLAFSLNEIRLSSGSNMMVTKLN